MKISVVLLAAALLCGVVSVQSQYEGSSPYSTTTNNGDGTSTTCTDSPGYSGCTTYDNGDSGRKLLSSVVHRALKANTGCTEGEWGSVCTKDLGNGQSQTCTTTKYYSGCQTYSNGGSGRKLLNTEPISVVHRGLKAYTGCSKGDWGSVCTKDLGGGQSQTCTTTAYYSGCQTYSNGE